MSTNNRMVEKSKKAIKDALLDIMYEKDFKQITVNELLKRANVSRGTFYAHFQIWRMCASSLSMIFLSMPTIFSEITQPVSLKKIRIRSCLWPRI